MKQTLLSLLLLSLLGFQLTSTKPAEDDGIARRLDQARRLYQEQLEQARKVLIDAMEKREAAARQLGDKAAVDQLKTERELFESADQLPKAVPTNVYSAQVAQLRRVMNAAFLRAISDYTRANLDDKADILVAELHQLQEQMADAANPAPARRATVDEQRNLPSAAARVPSGDDPIRAGRVKLTATLSGTAWSWSDPDGKVLFAPNGSITHQPSGLTGNWVAVDQARAVVFWYVKGAPRTDPNVGIMSMDVLTLDPGGRSLRKDEMGGTPGKKVYVEKFLNQ